MSNKIIIKDGLLWWMNAKNVDNVIDCVEADIIAQANGFMFAERLVKAYPDSTTLKMSVDRKIISSSHPLKEEKNESSPL